MPSPSPALAVSPVASAPSPTTVRSTFSCGSIVLALCGVRPGGELLRSRLGKGPMAAILQRHGHFRNSTSRTIRSRRSQCSSRRCSPFTSSWTLSPSPATASCTASTFAPATEFALRSALLCLGRALSSHSVYSRSPSQSADPRQCVQPLPH